MPYRVRLIVKESRGDCPYYKVGDKITFEEAEIIKEESDRLCIYALAALAPYLTALCRDTPKEDWINRKELIQCPDVNRPVIFMVEREPLK
ncbi:MAG: TIGR04076 family protein [Candidatus Bathyarchaeia archaeon]|nr:TIGR04076 family protein [Candidatus Bathyarchaeota archaeon]